MALCERRDLVANIQQQQQQQYGNKNQLWVEIDFRLMQNISQSLRVQSDYETKMAMMSTTVQQIAYAHLNSDFMIEFLLFIFRMLHIFYCRTMLCAPYSTSTSSSASAWSFFGFHLKSIRVNIRIDDTDWVMSECNQSIKQFIMMVVCVCVYIYFVRRCCLSNWTFRKKSSFDGATMTAY